MDLKLLVFNKKYNFHKSSPLKIQHEFDRVLNVLREMVDTLLIISLPFKSLKI